MGLFSSKPSTQPNAITTTPSPNSVANTRKNTSVQPPVIASNTKRNNQTSAVMTTPNKPNNTNSSSSNSKNTSVQPPTAVYSAEDATKIANFEKKMDIVYEKYKEKSREVKKMDTDLARHKLGLKRRGYIPTRSNFARSDALHMAKRSAQANANKLKNEYNKLVNEYTALKQTVKGGRRKTKRATMRK